MRIRFNYIFRRNIMKKALNFLTLPLVQVIVFAISAISYYPLKQAGYEFLALIAVVIYALAGFLYHKIEDKKIRLASIIFTVAFMWIITGVCAALSVAETVNVSGNLLYTVILCNPAVTNIANRFFNLAKIEPVIYAAVLAVLSPISVGITVASGKAFEVKNKVVKIIIWALLAALCILFLVLGIVDVTGANA